MIGIPKGYVFVKKEIKFSRKPPQLLYADYDVAEDYFNALRLKLAPVIDVAVSGDSYLVYGKGEKSGPFIWDIDRKDTTGEMIPYKFLHPETAEMEELLGLVARMVEGKATDDDYERMYTFAAMWASKVGIKI